MSDLSVSSSASLHRLIGGDAGKLGVVLDEGMVDRLARFAVLFLKWNERINLSAISGPDELVQRHFVDSYMASRLVPARAHVIDVGSGGGLPALPLASIRTDLSIECFEPTHKKAAFLRTAVRELGVGDRVLIRGQAIHQPIPPSLAHSADVAMSRATLEPTAWLELGRSLVRPQGGRVLVFGTGQSEATLPEATEALAYGRNRRLLRYG